MHPLIRAGEFALLVAFGLWSGYMGWPHVEPVLSYGRDDAIRMWVLPGITAGLLLRWLCALLADVVTRRCSALWLLSLPFWLVTLWWGGLDLYSAELADLAIERRCEGSPDGSGNVTLVTCSGPPGPPAGLLCRDPASGEVFSGVREADGTIRLDLRGWNPRTCDATLHLGVEETRALGRVRLDRRAGTCAVEGGGSVPGDQRDAEHAESPNEG